MSAVNAEIRSLASGVAASFETQAAATATSSSSSRNRNSNDSLPSSITLYRTGRILYSCHSGNSGSSNNDARANVLITSFETMMASLPTSYVHNVLLHDLHQAYASLIVSFTASASSTSTVTSAIRGMLNVKPAVSHSWKDILEGTESLCGIYLSSTNACQCCCLTLSSEKARHELELVFVSLSWVYEYLSSNKDTDNVAGDNNSMQKLVLKTLSRILTYGTVMSSGKSEQDTDEQLSSIMTLIQNIQSALGEYNCALGDMLDMKEKALGEPTFVDAIRSKFEAKGDSPPQLQYLLAMLRSSPKSNSKKTPSSNAKNTSTLLKPEPIPQSEAQQSMTDIQIEHIKGVLPSLGEGYIEEALKCYNHDVERTLEALLQVSEDGNNPNIHPRLLTIPNNLPRKLKESVDQYSANVNLHRGATAKDDGKEHAKIQKAHIKHVEQQAEDEAFLIDNVSRTLGGLRVSEEDGANDDPYKSSNMRDEYNDDYDDQYDGVGDDGGVAGGIGGMDEGLYDVDIHNVHQKYDRGGAKNEQEMWRKYNQVIKDVDKESHFWEENRNMNRAGGGGKVTHGKKKKAGNDEEIDEGEDGDGKKYRGPDKGRGGRLIGPDGKYLPIKRGGKKGRGGGGGAGGGGGGAGGQGGGQAGGRGAAGRGAGRGGKGGRGGSGGGRGGAGAKKGDANKSEGEGDMSKVQKRRKNDNKSKIGNHHRKDRATKKASGGMVM